MKTISCILVIVSFAAAQTDSVFIFLSDTQTPMWVEKLYLRSQENEQATQNILSAVLREENILAVVHTGDVTSYGSFRSSWEPMLPFIDSLRRRPIPLIVAKGNHDYYFFPSWAMEHFNEYLPEMRSEYAVHRFGSVALLRLNSNFEKLEEDTAMAQKTWYESQLHALDEDSAVTTIITVAHHSPFTNSDMVSGSETVRKEYLPAFYRSAKSRLWVGGHAHRFEHFQKKEKDFLVIGGGGGLHHGKRTEGVHNDLFPSDGRFFHYVRCAVGPELFLIEVRKITAEQAEPATVYRFEIPLKQK